MLLRCHQVGLLACLAYAQMPRSPYLMFYTCLLLGMVFGTVVSIMLSGWKLNKFLGGCMAVLYVIFIVTCVLIEELQPAGLKTND